MAEIVAGSAQAELDRCAVWVQAGDDRHDHRERDEDSLHLHQIPTPPAQPVDHDDQSDANGGQNQLVRGGHRRVVCPGLAISATGDRQPFGRAHAGHQARRRIVPHLLRIGPDVVNANRQ